MNTLKHLFICLSLLVALSMEAFGQKVESYQTREQLPDAGLVPQALG